MPTRLVSGEAHLPKLSYLSYTTKKQISSKLYQPSLIFNYAGILKGTITALKNRPIILESQVKAMSVRCRREAPILRHFT